MKVLFVTNMYPSANNDYYGIFVKEQIVYLQKHFGVQAEIYFINGRKRFLGPLYYLISILAINWKIFFNDYDKIHVHYGLSGLFLLFNFWYPKNKLVITLHGGDFLPDQGKRIQNRITELILPRFGSVISINERIGKMLRQRNIESIFIPCGVDTNYFKFYDKTKSWNKFKIVFPGYPERWVKNYPLFSEIVTQLRAELSGSVQIEEIILKNCTREQVRDIFNTAHCLLLTSHSEASPQVIKEALACNLPILSTNVGDVELNIAGLPYCNVFRPVEINEAVNHLKVIFEKKIENIDLRKRVFELELDQAAVIKKVYQLYQN